METSNQSFFTEFFILGLSQNSHLQGPIFIVFFHMYLTTLLGNIVIITIICADFHLQKPMYYFLMNLSFLDICFTSGTIPKMLEICLTGNKSIKFLACILQFYICSSFICTEFFLLSVMALDRYVAICQPLRYTVIMSKRAVVLLAAASWLLGFLGTIPHTVLISTLSFCGSHEINHFFCDLTALLKLSCTDTFFINIATFAEGVVIGLCPFILTIISYVLIISNIMKMSSTGGRKKSFSTCSAHLTAVLLFYGTELGVYMRTTSGVSLEKDKLFAVMFTIVIPMVNPFIYSLRNNEVKRALRKFKKNICYQENTLHKVE
ncbi:olfactory receptor 5V1-like [Lissotriton helveticus]